MPWDVCGGVKSELEERLGVLLSPVFVWPAILCSGLIDENALPRSN